VNSEKICVLNLHPQVRYSIGEYTKFRNKKWIPVLNFAIKN
jgi:hypothetical protein